MLLIPFVENAFKHGSLITGFLEVEVEIALIQNQLQFSIRNTALNHDLNQKSSGIGLENIKKRLDLHYNNDYQLQVEQKNNWFSVNLTISNINILKNV